MLRFPTSHTFFQFSGYPGYFQDMTHFLMHLQVALPNIPQANHSSAWIESDSPEVQSSHDCDLGLNQLIAGSIQFWRGFAGGGILGFPTEISLQAAGRLVLKSDLDGVETRRMRGTFLGNIRPIDRTGFDAGESLIKYVQCVEPRQIPPIAVKYGLAPKVPEPRVGVTIEHLVEAGEDRWLLVVPKADRKRPLKHQGHVSEWFSGFDVKVGPAKQVPKEMRAAMSDWFDDALRPMQIHQISGGVDDAAWQLAVVNYVADHWSIQERGLNSVHLIARIEREPGFRRYWTSNR